MSWFSILINMIEARNSLRMPAVAGMFYPADAAQCQQQAQQLYQSGLSAARQWTDDALAGQAVPAMGAIVPHAGWICSGEIAAESLAALAMQKPKIDLVVVFGAIHTPIRTTQGMLDSHQQWHMPGGDVAIDADFRRRLGGVDAAAGSLAAAVRLFAVDDRFHQREHAVEVLLPLIQLAWPGAAVLPVETPVVESAVEIGRQVAKQVIAAGLNAVYLASSDFTHYGPSYQFVPAGIGPAALDWALANDRRLLSLVTDMKPERIVPEVCSHGNACGGGAIAAMMSACQVAGATKAAVLCHTNSYQTLAKVAPQQPVNAVGYASAVVW